MAISLSDSPTLGLKDSFALFIRHVATLLPLLDVTDLDQSGALQVRDSEDDEGS